MKSKIFNLSKKIHFIIFRSWMPPINPNCLSIILDHIKTVSIVKFIQIGSNDGKTGDPLYNHIRNKKVKGVLIEPVEYLFKKLKSNYKGISDVYFENVAIGEKDANCDFFVVEQYENLNLPNWYNQLSSFKLETILKHKNEIPNLEELIIKKSIPTKTITSIIEKYKLFDLDILHIDTEGYDFEIIKTINFNKIKPKILLFEHKHLDLDDYKKCIKLLNKHFSLIQRNDKGDTICFNP